MASIVRERVIARLHQRQVEETERRARDQILTTRFDEPLPLSPSPTPSTSSHPHNPTQQPSREGRGTSLRWRLLSRRLPEAVERNVEEQSYQFFTGTAEDLEMPVRITRQGGREEGEVRGGGTEVVEEEGEREGAARDDEREGEGDGTEEDEDVVEGESGDAVHSSGPDLEEPTEEGTEPAEEGTEESPDESSQQVPETDTEDSALLRGRGASRQLLRPPTTIYVPHRVRLEREDGVYFTPSSGPPGTAVEERTPSGMPPRFCEDEGLYVGRRPRLKWTNRIIVENRLLHRYDKGRGLFGEDGVVLALPDPLQESPLRPPILAHDPTRHISCSPHHAKQKRATNRKMIPQGSGSYQLDLTLSSLHFSHHPLFSLEHVMCAGLSRSCDDYHLLMDHTTSDYLLQKLYALKTASVDLQQSLEHLDGGSSEEVEARLNLRRYTREVRSLRRQWREREASKHRLLLSILRMWGLLKSVRDRQGYSSTSLSITFRRYSY
ncbi:Coiled-coil and C2 domain-containing protein 2A [Geodia barretti]|uniref:Coiled-coil and C2 domain-containing protein 2A n=1 Tax=Geodia barretti TaxID=519541 RepID=A0AA35TCZ0_GEOBA|nr:Coiled-coil and C2 domain-containing protein 2A [Geodia barretti]